MSRTSQLSPGGAGGVAPSDSALRGGVGGVGRREESARGANSRSGSEVFVLVVVLFALRRDVVILRAGADVGGGGAVAGLAVVAGSWGVSGAGLIAPRSASSCQVRSLGRAGEEPFARS